MTSPQNQKYTTYRNAVKGRPSHDKRQHAEQIWWSSAMWCSSYVIGLTDKELRCVSLFRHVESVFI